VNDIGGAALRERVALLRYDLLHEVPTAHELGDDVVVAAIFKEVEDTRDVRVLCLLEHLKLVLIELLVDLVLFQLLLADDLDGAVHLRTLVLSNLDFAKRARTKLTTERVVLSEGLYALKFHL